MQKHAMLAKDDASDVTALYSVGVKLYIFEA